MHHRPRLNPDILSQRVGEELILVHSQTNQIYELSGSAARLWELLESGASPQEAHGKLLLEYEVETKRLEAEIVATLSVLAQEHILELPTDA